MSNPLYHGALDRIDYVLCVTIVGIVVDTVSWAQKLYCGSLASEKF